jgi:hypothetical protein
MAFPVTFGGETFNAADFDGYAYAATWERYLSAVSQAGQDSATLVATATVTFTGIQTLAQNAQTNAAASASAAAASLALAQAITGGAQGVGGDSMDVPRNVELGCAAFWEADGLRGRFPVARGAAYQLVPQDYGRTLIAETGTLTWTLPLLSSLTTGWWFSAWNRSGNTLTIQRSGADVIGSAGTSVTVADGAGILVALRDTTRFERIG